MRWSHGAFNQKAEPLNLHRTRTALAAILVTIGLLSGCTPEQLSTLAGLGHDTTHLTDAPDIPTRLPDGTTIELDGTITAAPVGCQAAKDQANGLAYRLGESGPAIEAFRLIAIGCRGWTVAETDSWQTAVKDIMRGESHFCPNLLRGARPDNNCYVGSKRHPQGRHEDAGFGQLIRLHYKPGAWLCREEGLCSKWAVIASPANSMTALLALIERSGVQGWCYNARARRIHRVACSNRGMDV